jgi:2-amino-4-hydroxy-6-hydroxymethyldihydropteridine diphosphokinase
VTPKPKLIAYVGLGANLGDAQAAVTNAQAQLANIPGVTQLQHSSLYRSAPVLAQGSDFINAVSRLTLNDTQTPQGLLTSLQALEQANGRERPYPNAPRTLDLDLLLWFEHDQSLTLQTPSLTLPHPRMHKRAFVLIPLLELAPQIILNETLGTAASYHASVKDQRVERQA